MSSYWERTAWPLQGLYFLLPIMAFYELGAWWYRSELADYSLKAKSLLNNFFHWFGVTGFFLPGLIVVVVLLCWHVVRRDPWRPQPWLHVSMWLESIALAVVLFVFSAVLFREPVMGLPAAQAVVGGPQDLVEWWDGWKINLLLSMGAGIYEELVFRLIAIALFHMILVDILALPEHYGALGAVLGSAIAFGLIHFGFDEASPFHWGRFLFFTGAGVYLAAVYLLRGFGIVVATHAIYDIFVISAPFLQQGTD